MMLTPYKLTAKRLTQAILILGFLLVVAANMPGQLSNDSVRQLHEAHIHMRETWGPVVYASILSVFDQIIPGTGLYLVSSVFLFFATLWGILRSRDRVSWFAPAVALVLILSPSVMMYQGIVWKDVLFANLGVASFVLLAHIAKVWRADQKPWIAIAALVIALAVAGQVRQNGLITAIVAAGVLGWTLRGLGWRRAALWGLGLLTAVVLVSHILALACTPKTSLVQGIENQGIRSLIQYDIVGMAAHDPAVKLEVISAQSPRVAQTIMTYGVPLYVPERIDYLQQNPRVGQALDGVPLRVVGLQWISLVRHHPMAYIHHRWDVFAAVFLTPHIDSCLPLYVGVDGPAENLADLKLTSGVDAVDQKLYNYGTRFLDTPAISHLAFAGLAIALIAGLLIRRSPQDIAMAGLLLSGLAFAGSFFLISIACDYRYLYFLDLATLAGLFYLAVDPPWTRAQSGKDS